MRNQARRRKGAGMTEYVVIVGLIAIGLVPAVSGYGRKLYETIVGTDQAIQDGVVKPIDAGGGGMGGNGGGNNGGSTRPPRPPVDPTDPDPPG